MNEFEVTYERNKKLDLWAGAGGGSRSLRKIGVEPSGLNPSH